MGERALDKAWSCCRGYSQLLHQGQSLSCTSAGPGAYDKVYTLEKVLRVKKDAVSHIEFLEEVMKTLDEKPSFTFWTTLAKAFETQTKAAAQCKL